VSTIEQHAAKFSSLGGESKRKEQRKIEEKGKWKTNKRKIT